MTLEAFRSENTLPAKHDSNGSEISLADLKSRCVPLQWFEAVAIIQGLCGALLESRTVPDEAALSPKHVFIGPAGSIRISSTAAAGEPVVRQVGELLMMMLADSAFPVPLRLVTTQAISTPPFYSSIAEVSSALEFYERPDRAGLIRAVYERAQRHPAPVGAAEQAASEPEAEKPVPRKEHKRRPIRKKVVAVSTVLLAVAVPGLVVLQLSSTSRVDAAAAGAQSTASALSGLAATVGSLADRVNPFAAASASDGDASAVSPPATPKSVDKPKRKGSAKAVPQAVSQHTAPERLPEPALAIFETIVVPEALPIEAIAGDAAAEWTIFTASDLEVTPPVATYPRLPAEPPAGIRADHLSTLEVLVDETGHVESVRLRGQPTNLGEALRVTVNLSAAKTWRFLPAVKDGRPVKYRKLIQVWPTTP
jgi:hypothetical protein